MLCSIAATIQDDIFDNLQLCLRYIGVCHFGRGIYDSEVHAFLNGMIEEYSMHRLTDIVVASE